jgi:acyl carrier protein
MAQSLETRVFNLIAGHLDLDPDDFDESSFLMDDLAADPYELEELAHLLAEEFDIEVTEEDFESWESVSDVIHFVAEKLQEAE